MITSVQECVRSDYRRRVVFGRPASVTHQADGRLCQFAHGAVVAYEIVLGRRSFGCVFRAGRGLHLDVSADMLEVPGVQPAVRMLIPYCRGRRFARALALLQELDSRGKLERLPDAAFLRGCMALSSAVSTSLLADAIEQCEGRPWIS